MNRLLTAVALIPAVAYVVLWANYWVFLAVLILVALLCYHEYAGIAEGYGFGRLNVLGYGAGVVLLVWQAQTWPLIAVIALVALAAAMRADNLSKTLPRAALLVMGVIYVFGCWKAALDLRQNYSQHWLMYALVLNWAGDSGAFYVGRTFGKHRLAPRVSPMKSWEGAAASVVTSALVGGAYLLHFIPGTSLFTAIGLTIVANMAGQLGDLAESAIKRGASVKDSSGMLPGHGGFLDRVDSTLFALPVIYIWLKLMV
ncbi:MAG TPA: phosphatidate cytidylyltransferase [Bryobacteraceae bacterium]|jgi:phosphatidate cytidylyltransferase|nr:phosphatidate cytidylyltransferase [Bryobacteraceae bacterium]